MTTNITFLKVRTISDFIHPNRRPDQLSSTWGSWPPAPDQHEQDQWLPRQVQEEPGANWPSWHQDLRTKV